MGRPPKRDAAEPRWIVHFVRLAEVINKHHEKRVMSVTVKPALTDGSGTVWFTDLMLQEGMARDGIYPADEGRLFGKVENL